MRLAHAVRVGSWVLVGLNLLMAVGAIAIFSRMAPAIAVIIDQNDRTLQACEDMLSILAHVGNGSCFSAEEEQDFRKALTRAKDNITESEEPLVLKRIESHLQPLFAGDRSTRGQTIDTILHLGAINRNAMTVADGTLSTWDGPEPGGCLHVDVRVPGGSGLYPKPDPQGRHPAGRDPHGDQGPSQWRDHAPLYRCGSGPGYGGGVHRHQRDP
jgi:hypothetical protein